MRHLFFLTLTLSIFLIAGCSERQNIISQDNYTANSCPNETNIQEIIVEMVIQQENFCSTVWATIEEVLESRKIMYINAYVGVNLRTGPSLNSAIIKTLPYGERIVVTLRSEMPETIGGITDYWYQMWPNQEWVFGGNLSKNFPLGISIPVGEWEISDRRGIFYLFRNDNSFTAGMFETCNTVWDSWSLNENSLTIVLEPDERMENPGYSIHDVRFEVLNHGNLIFEFQGDDFCFFSGRKTIELIRSTFPLLPEFY